MRLEHSGVSSLLEHGVVVVGLKDEVGAEGYVALDGVGGFAHIGHDGEGLSAHFDAVARVFRCVVRYGEGCDREGSYLKSLSEGYCPLQFLWHLD